MCPSGLDISSHRRPKKDIIDKICPNSSDIEVARDFLYSIGAYQDFFMNGFSTSVEIVVKWMQVSLVSYADGIDIKSEAEKP
jgi:hypothetical protein